MRREWALQDVEVLTDGEFKAASMSAYERGERAISVERLLRVAQLYAVEPMELVPALEEQRKSGGRGRGGAPKGTSSRVVPAVPLKSSATGPAPAFRFDRARLRVDLVRLGEMSGSGWEQARNLVSSIRRRRGSRAGRFLDVRAGDVWMLVAALGVPPGEGLGVLLREGVVRMA